MRTHLFLSTAQVFEGLFHEGDKGWAWPRLIPSPDADTRSLHNPWEKLSSKPAPLATSKEKPSPWIPRGLTTSCSESTRCSAVSGLKKVCADPQVLLLVEKEAPSWLAAAGTIWGVGEGCFTLPLTGPWEPGEAARCISQVLYLNWLHWIKGETLHMKLPPPSPGWAEPPPPSSHRAGPGCAASPTRRESDFGGLRRQQRGPERSL